MLYTKFQGHRPADFGEGFFIYGYGSHLSHMTETIWTNFRYPYPVEAPTMKFSFDWSCDFWEDVMSRMDGQLTKPAYTISSPMSL